MLKISSRYRRFLVRQCRSLIYFSQVGVGALAGSTIMLLTIPWFLSILGGRVDLDSQGRPNYRKSPKLAPDNLWSFQTSGIALAGSVRSGAWFDLLPLPPPHDP
jgi:hypothetical protein